MRSDSIVGIVSLLFGMAYTVQTLHLPKAMVGNPWAPLFFPLTLGVLLMAVGAVVLLQGLRQAKAEAKKKGSKRLIVVTVLICLVYSALFEHLGFILSTILFLGGLLFVINGARAWKVNSVIAVTFSLGVWYVFEKIFYMNLP
ncbi:tripartite tricarboxylate transporter TctB family protein [Aminirod propionatiphilus]|uniref:Tripartite tricarboxylate transporter TctB family protein n=1 Tax=Aminirod propionatiphilus TaxID=3415223 RepID=A0ACD1DWX3_9BACT|nr:tripartite tricarboxylate transporter TctB family protein [Synergistota bacterium]